MKKEQIFNALDGIYAFDTGSTDSGIKDEVLRQQVIDYLDSLDEDEFRIILSDFIREYFVSYEAIKKGYGIEDVASFIKWLDKYMGIEL
ncbi:hypothetical protein [Bacillus thuringiensis]|uniref:CdiI immunity protein domain-containing protein n=1 Tax=Bacillus thuringiensis serovar andalousiensis TaxID=257985 RepID=A0A6H0T9V3_BACTU|nr:hypothetical protein [Bacillus thuringiensis]QIW17175.1 hypothetical protein EVG22_01385 [Bacillus thuringiensis serovar andalousiensis]